MTGTLFRSDLGDPMTMDGTQRELSFQHWLDYGEANSKFKDNPGETGAYATTGGQYDPTVTGYATLRSPSQHSGSHEANLVQQPDDLIARVVVESDASGEDVFRALLTTRLAFVPSHGTDSRAPYAYDWIDPVALDDASRWVTYPDDSIRRGVLTHPAWLASHGGNFEDDPSLVLPAGEMVDELGAESGDLRKAHGPLGELWG